ncbi:major capsid protein [Variovorax terrae]|uniref:Major capsid protein n=1 Tax=Variovorax terrae TaxID=2923278 RepID=A0A9X1VYK9_9BURK|nr:major capsid protein [Variovorax terrae]MCJ0765330.1 major capsid protein [Variovorax terrae]
MRKQIAIRLAAIPAFVLATSGAAFAEVPAAVTTAITGTGTDLVTVITAVIVAFVAFWGLKKLASKMGWM